MGAVDTAICIPMMQVTHPRKKISHPLASRRGGRINRMRSSIGISEGVFDVKHPHFGIASAGYQSLVIGMWHEFDGEDIGLVPSGYGCIQGKWRGGRIRLVGVNVKVCIIGAGC